MQTKIKNNINTENLPEVYSMFKYNLKFFIEQLQEKDRVELKKKIREKWGLSDRMFRHYYGALKTDKNKNLSVQRLEIAAIILGVTVEQLKNKELAAI